MDTGTGAVGKAAAKDLLTRLVAEGVPMREALARAGLPTECLGDLLDPAHCTGVADALADRALTEYAEFRSPDRGNSPDRLG